MRWLDLYGESVSGRMLWLELAVRRPSARTKGRSMDAVRENMKLDGVRENDAEERERWRQMIGCGQPWRQQPRGRGEDSASLSIFT